jgi:hypothetical protein
MGGAGLVEHRSPLNCGHEGGALLTKVVADRCHETG